MQIAILSDTHDRQDMVVKALQEMQKHHIETVLHCGDIEGPAIVHLFAGMDAHFVFGNCDWNQTSLRIAMTENGLTCHENAGVVELDGVKIAFTHSHDAGLMAGLEQSDDYDFLFYGHTHIAEEHHTGKTRVINPGALHRASPKSFLLFDLANGETTTIVVDR